MDIMTLFYVVVYFTIGWFLSDWLNTDDSDELAVFIFVFWPIMVAFLVLILVLALAMFVAVLISKLISIFDNKGGGIDGAV